MELNSRKGKRCCIYIRVSSERQVEGFSLDGQKRYLSEWAAFEGMEVAAIYVDASDIIGLNQKEPNRKGDAEFSPVLILS